ncbi:hypothetical protein METBISCDRAFT_25266 [Metschnikowia bicuspidata]|uniref:Uncharacterized protein n=1 Tax=Metschnikowia bicuspidata TaxID=27322 RepID=A0A4P9ZIS5_9ASCO|nr:hypothetical protein METBISCDRAFT_25266 [Metschnikowia bicuspidata]
MTGRRYSLTIETKNRDTDVKNEPVIGFLVERSSTPEKSPTPHSSPSLSGSEEYCLCDLDNIGQQNRQFHYSSSLNAKKKHFRRHTVAVRFQEPHSAHSTNVAGRS